MRKHKTETFKSKGFKFGKLELKLMKEADKNNTGAIMMTGQRVSMGGDRLTLIGMIDYLNDVMKPGIIKSLVGLEDLKGSD